MRTIALLTVREIRRRRVVLIMLILTLIFTAVVAWGLDRLVSSLREQHMLEAQITIIVSQLVVMVMFMFSFVLGMTAVFVTSPAISGDVESGVVLAVVARPIRRADVLLGKWAATSLVMALYGIAGGALLLGVIAWLGRYVPPDPLAFLLYLAAEAVIGVTFAMLLSTLVTPMAAGAIAVACFGLAWIAGIAANVGALLQLDALVRVGTLSRLLLPTDGLWRGALFHLEPTAVVLAMSGAPSGVAGNPFLSLSPPTLPYLAWCVAWVAAVLALALWVFRRREL